MYSTLAQFKQYLWIDSTDTSQDTLLTQILNSANLKLNNLCWVDSFELWTYTQTIEARWIYESIRWLEFFLKNKPVQSIDKMNWVNYEWTKWTDYLVIYDRRIITKKVSLNDWNMLEIEYTAWYDRNLQVEWSQTPIDTLPDDLKLLEMMIACWLLPDSLKSQCMIGISEYKLWDETIRFWSKTSSNWAVSEDDVYFSFTTLLNKYRNFILPV